MHALIHSLTSFPLFGLLLSLAAFYLGQRFYLLTGRKSFFQPVIAGMLMVIVFLVVTGISYQQYFASAQLLYMLLGPTIVALAVPLFQHAKRIRALFLPILLTLLTGSVFTVGIAVGIMWLFDARESSIISMTTKSITTPIAMAVSEKLGGIGSLSAVLVLVTGAIGAIIGIPILHRLGIRDNAVKGVTMGLNAHAIGTARALEEGEECGAFSALAMGLNGVLTAIILPLLFAWLRS